MSIVKDMSLAPSGQRKIDWVRSFMPALSQIEARFAREKPFSWAASKSASAGRSPLRA